MNKNLIALLGFLLLILFTSSISPLPVNESETPEYDGFKIGQNLEEILSVSQKMEYNCKVLEGTYVFCKKEIRYVVLYLDQAGMKSLKLAIKSDVEDLQSAYNKETSKITSKYGKPYAYSKKHFFALWKAGGQTILFYTYPVTSGKLSMIEIIPSISESGLMKDIQAAVKINSDVICQVGGKEVPCSAEQYKALWKDN
jgi:hypothetical protein